MVRVNEDYIIDIDSYNYTVKLDQHKKIQVKDKTSGEYVSVDSFKTVGYYKDMSQAIKGIIEDINRRELSSGSFTLEESLKIILKNNNKVSELLENVLEVQKMICLIIGLVLGIAFGGAVIAICRLGEYLKGNSWDGLQKELTKTITKTLTKTGI